MSTTCEFQLNSANGVFYSDQVICGAITLNTTQEDEILSIRLRLLGEAKVYWAESERYRNKDGLPMTRSIAFKANEVYVNNTSIVRGAGILPPGTHTYTFLMPIDSSCRTSCEGKFGHIRYTLWVLVDRPMQLDSEFSKLITVLKTVDLNLNPAFKVPLQVEESKSIGFWPFTGGQIIYTLRIPFGAYAAGQSVPYMLTIQNESRSDITGYRAELYETFIFTVNNPYKNSIEKDTVLATQQHSDICLSQSNCSIEGAMILPSLPPDTEGESIIRILHRLEVNLLVDGYDDKCSISVPIVIGNVPIRESMSAEEENRFMDMMPTAPPLVNGENYLDIPPAYEELKPPSYEEAMRSHSPFQESCYSVNNQAMGFRPLYPTCPPKE